MKTVMLLVALFLITLSITACNPTQTNEQISLQPEEEKIDKGNLSSRLNGLIIAYEMGEAEEFAQPRNIELIDGSVTVIIECEDGQCEKVGQAAKDLGATEVGVKEHRNWVRATVPIPKLNALVDISGVRLVHLPWIPEEEE